MGLRKISVALLLSIVPAAGCGTVANLARSGPANRMTPFGGVKQDLACIQDTTSGDPGVRPHAKADSERYPQRALVVFCAVDLPFSLLGDIVTWPYTAVYSFINQPVPVPPVIEVPPLPPAVQPGPVPTPVETQPKPMPLPTIPVIPAKPEGPVRPAP